MKIFILATTLLLAAQTSPAQLFYWDMPTSAEQVAFGDVSFMQSNEPQGLTHNPAELGFMKYRLFKASGIQWWQNVYGGSANTVMPAGRLGTFSAGLGYWSLGTMTGYTDDGSPLGTVQAQASDLGLGYGYALAGAWALGLNLKASRLDLPDRYDWGWSTDLALSYKKGNAKAGLMIRDLGPDYPKNSDFRRSQNTAYMLGARISGFGGLVCGSLQYNLRNEEGGYPGLALEISPLTGLTLMAGYDDVPEINDRSPLGFGMRLEKLGQRDLSISYGYRAYGDLGSIQAITMGIGF